MAEKTTGKVKSHQVYKLKSGERVSGTTTIINDSLGWNKQVLLAWTRREALAGNDPDKVRDDAADIGTCAHYLCDCDDKGITPDLSEYSQAHIDIAENCFLGYLDWKKEHGIVNVNSEVPLVSEQYRFGGTIDKFCENDKVVLADIKTSNGIYVEHKIQIAAYHQLCLENGYNADEVWIIHLAKNGEFAAHRIANLELYWEVFKHCLALRELQKELKKS